MYVCKYIIFFNLRLICHANQRFVRDHILRFCQDHILIHGNPPILAFSSIDVCTKHNLILKLVLNKLL